MTVHSNFENKNILIVGFGKSGYSAAKLLAKSNARVTLTDISLPQELSLVHELTQLGVHTFFGGHPVELLDNSIDFVVKNPGIPYETPFIQQILTLNIPIFTEIEVAYQLFQPSQIIGITGTNGKTTTTTLIHDLLEEANKDVKLAGNIGYPLSEVLPETNNETIVVAELSSFQLLGINTFKPKVSLLLNLSDAHLDYHKTFEHYKEAKFNIFKNLTHDDFAVINADNDMILNFSATLRNNKLFFSTNYSAGMDAYIVDNQIFYRKEKIIDVKQIKLLGKHNLENILASICVAKIYGVPNEAIRTVISNFVGVTHRLQYLGKINERFIYNNSKSTNILSTLTALNSFEKPVALIAGGLDRGNDFDELINGVSKVKTLISFGQTNEKLHKFAVNNNIPQAFMCENLEEAVEIAMQNSIVNDIILLSPCCASWDQFKNFEERGECFIRKINEYAK